MTWLPRVSVLMAVSVLVLAACSSGDSESVFDLRPGDCFDDVIENGEIAEESETLPMVDCDDPHDNEAYALYNMDDGAFPTQAAIDDEAIAKCVPLFEDYVGSEYDTSRLDIFWIFPTAESWDEGDREVACVLYDLDLNKLTGSMANSGE
ncbi:MAG: septum formation family protein [Actinomycetia bacterium]|nr:septum formation family protein [Actinomycetes bacterium]